MFIGTVFGRLQCRLTYMFFFLGLIVHNKSLTRDNLAKSQVIPDTSCVFCSEAESIKHLFFDCIVSRQIWEVVADVLHIHIPCSFESLLSFWKINKKFAAVNIFTTATLWGLWRIRNDFVFQGRRWRSMKCVIGLVGSLVRQWKILCPDAQASLLLDCLRLLDHR